MRKGQAKEMAHGPDWVDLACAIEQVGRAHHKTLYVTTHARKNRDGSYHMVWVVRVYGNVLKGEPRVLTQVERSWPTPNWKELPAMLYDSVMIIDSRLTQQALDAAAQARF